MPPKLIDIGLPRTGTQSLANALAILDYPHVYHMREVDQNPGHRQKWINLIHAKYNPAGHPSGPIPDFLKELQGLLKDYDACADYPSSLFPAELLQAYPEAKVIVTIRDERDWCASMKRTLVYPQASRVQAEKEGRPRNEMREAYNLYCWGDDFDANGLDYWREHYAMLKELVVRKEVLWYDVREGWGPLCKFLGVAVPEEGFPNDDVARSGGSKVVK